MQGQKVTLVNSIVITIDDKEHSFRERDCATIPAGMKFSFTNPSADCEFLEVSLPALDYFELLEFQQTTITERAGAPVLVNFGPRVLNI